MTDTTGPKVVAARSVRRVPVFPWSARSRWHPTAASFGILQFGLVLFGIGDALFVNSRLGNTPWTVLANGLERHSSLDIGEATILISVMVLLLWIPLRERPGLGTISNAIVIGLTVKYATQWLPEPQHIALRIVFVAAGVLTVGVGAALYLSTHHGPGPRDGLMTGIAIRLAQPLARVRITLEILVLAAGFILGGRLGPGTLVFALTIGHVLTYMLARLSALVHAET
jgi:uncharacterized protein